MNEEQKAAFIMAQAAVLNATIAGMTAENMQREAVGSSMAYGEDAFQDAINASGCHHNAVLTLFQN